MINFLDSKLFPKLTCSKAATDNYEPHNLISENSVVRTRGYIAYSAIKPPVDIDFEFLCPVCIDCIVLGTTVGKQKCTGIEIYAKTAFGSYISVARAIYTEPGVVFCSGKKLPKPILPENVDSSYYLGFFKRDAVALLKNTTIIKVNIFRTEKSVPCMRLIEVWGRVSDSCSAVTRETVDKLVRKSSKNSFEVHNDEILDNHSKFEIPEDFKDALTYEIMTIPMTLPSGKTIDKATLEKHNKNEASFGRKPCDPFTGLKLTGTMKAILNVSLKSRIDMFLLENSNNPSTFSLRRTVGNSESGFWKNITSPSLTSQEISNCNKNYSRVDDELDKVLDSAISTSNLKSFASVNPKQCLSCESDENLYSVPCKHYYCRTCLVNVCISLQCVKCKTNFRTSDVQRYHCNTFLTSSIMY